MPFNAKSRELFDFAYSKSSPDFYSPAEDSYLFLDTLEAELDPILCRLSNPLIVEVGPGSGVLCGFLSRSLKDRQHETRVLAVDVNPAATDATVKTFACVSRHTGVDALLGDATTSLIRSGTVDIILCNPPYVPSERDEFNHPLVAAWAGGLPDGREVTDRVIEQASKLLTVNGIMLLLLDERNVPAAVCAFALTFGLKGRMLSKRKVPGEILSVWLFERIPIWL